MNSQWIRARFHGNELRSYQRHFWSHSLSAAASTPGGAERARSALASPRRWRGRSICADQRAAVGVRRRAGRPFWPEPLAVPADLAVFAGLAAFPDPAVRAALTGSTSARNVPV